MFLKSRIRTSINKFITMNGLDSETLVLFEHGAIDTFMPTIKRYGLDADQGAIVVITGTIVNGAQNGQLMKLKRTMPNIYSDLVVLWQFCGSLLAKDEERWGHAVVVGDFDVSPFKYAEQNP